MSKMASTSVLGSRRTGGAAPPTCASSGPGLSRLSLLSPHSRHLLGHFSRLAEDAARKGSLNPVNIPPGLPVSSLPPHNFVVTWLCDVTLAGGFGILRDVPKQACFTRSRLFLHPKLIFCKSNRIEQNEFTSPLCLFYKFVHF